jgi:hypothetical protein
MLTHFILAAALMQVPPPTPVPPPPPDVCQCACGCPACHCAGNVPMAGAPVCAPGAACAAPGVTTVRTSTTVRTRVGWRPGAVLHRVFGGRRCGRGGCG